MKSFVLVTLVDWLNDEVRSGTAEGEVFHLARVQVRTQQHHVPVEVREIGTVWLDGRPIRTNFRASMRRTPK